MAKNWYVIHTYAGFEGRVKTSLLERANQMGLVEKLGAGTRADGGCD